MKSADRLGEFYFKALIKIPGRTGWVISDSYYSQIKDVVADFPNQQFKYPIEQIDKHGVYVPSEAEINETLT